MGDKRFVVIKLTEREILEGAWIGLRRRVYDELNKIGDKYKADRDSYARQWLYEITGAVAERAVSKYLGIEWDGSLGNFKAKDVGPYQVRSTQKRWHRLHLRKSDDPNDVYIKVSVEEPNLFREGVYLEGWAYGSDVMKEENWKKVRDDRPAQYLLDNDQLRRMATLPELVPVQAKLEQLPLT